MSDEIRILVLESGWVIVCRCPDPTGYPFWLPYTDMRVIRRWGTTKGLAELKEGPLANTILDDLVSEGKCPVRAIINVFEGLNQDKWENHLVAKGEKVKR